MKKKYLVTLISCLLSPFASAADTLFDDVVVSVSRSEQKSFDASASIQSVGREIISSVGPQVNLSESLNRVPGIVILNRQNYSQDLQISIRGFGARTQFGVRGVRLITDGIPATMPDGQGQASSISLTSTERIEVLRGPLAQLYGNSAGGVIQTFTRQAPENPEFLMQGYTGSYGLARTDWQYAQKVGQFGLVADYSTFKTDGYRQNSQAERNQFNGKLDYDHDDKTRISFLANNFNMPYAYDAAGLATVADALNNPTSSLAPPANRNRKDVEQGQYGLVLTHKLNVDTVFNLRAYDGNRKMLAYSGTATNTNKWQQLDRDYYGFGFDFGSKMKIADRQLTWTVGYSYDKSTESNIQGSALNGEKTASVPTVNKNQDSRNSDIYIQSNYFFIDRMSITAGVRSTEVALHAYDVKNTKDLGAVTYRAINPVVGYTYYAFDNMNLFANYGRGFETPTLTEIGYTTVSNAPLAGFNNNLQASKSDHYEVGMKWLPSRKSRIDLSAFYIKTKDELVVDTNNSNNNSSYKNVPGGTTRKGWELSVISNEISNWKGTLSLSQIDATFNTTFTTGTTTKTTVNSGNKIAGIPNGQLFAEILWSENNFRRNKYGQVLGLVLGVDSVLAGELYANDSNASTLRAPGYGIFNAKVSYRKDFERVTLTGYGQLNNFTDKRYVGSVIVGNASPFEPGLARNWLLGVNAVVRF